MHILQTYRAARGISRKQLAVKLGVSPITVAAIENGFRRITPEKAKEWEPILGVEKAMLCPEIFGTSKAERAA